VLPYGLTSRADEVAGVVDANALAAVNADPEIVDRLATAVRRFGRAAEAYEARKGSIPDTAVAEANTSLLEIERLLNGNLTALSAWDWTAYPHEQVLGDVWYLDKAIAALRSEEPDRALRALGNVALTWYGQYFSHQVYLYDLERRLPSHPRVTWGAQGHLIDYLDVMPQYRDIEKGRWDASTLKDLRGMRNGDLTDLDSRLDSMAQVLEEVTRVRASADAANYGPRPRPRPRRSPSQRAGRLGGAALRLLRACPSCQTPGMGEGGHVWAFGGLRSGQLSPQRSAEQRNEWLSVPVRLW
jgi:hypothetical protein